MGFSLRSKSNVFFVSHPRSLRGLRTDGKTVGIALRRFDISLNELAKQKLFAKTMNEGSSCEVGEMDVDEGQIQCFSCLLPASAGDFDGLKVGGIRLTISELCATAA
jgi:hypothetical protein